MTARGDRLAQGFAGVCIFCWKAIWMLKHSQRPARLWCIESQAGGIS
jgi:hypothetical protein